MTVKKTLPRQSMILVNIEKTPSHRHPGREYYRLHFVEPESFQEYESIADPDMRNFRKCKWHRIVESFDPYHIYSVVPTMIKSRSGRLVVDADHEAVLEQRLTPEQLEWLIKNLGELHDAVAKR